MGVNNNEDMAQQQTVPPTIGQVHQFRAQSLQRTLNDQLNVISMLEQQIAMAEQTTTRELTRLGQLIAKHAERILKLEEENRVLNCRNAGLVADLQTMKDKTCQTVEHTPDACCLAD